MEIKRTNGKDNPILARIIMGMNMRGSKIKIFFNRKNAIGIKAHKMDCQEIAMFLLGVFKEVYNNSEKDKVFVDAVKEILTEYLKECKK
jgi:hypothetical protein